MKYLPLMIFTSYSMLTLNTAYYDKGSIEINRKLITKNYFKTEFRLDFITIVPLFLGDIFNL